jgi:NAD(P)H-hydrate epimerase
MLTLNRAQQQTLDQAWPARTGLPLLVLMEQAASAVTRCCQDLSGRVHGDRLPEQTQILVLAGKGQNGGDAFACARQLAALGYKVTCLSVFTDPQLPPEASLNRNAWLRLGYPLADWTPDQQPSGYRPDLIVDGIFGTGCRADRPMPAVVQAWSSLCQAWRKEGSRLVAIDIPTGVDANTGQLAEGAFAADITVTMIRPKTGICAAPGRFQAGEIRVDRLGIADEFVESVFAGQSVTRWTDADMIRRLSIRRPPDSHKATFGRALILGGSQGMPGAAVLAAEAAGRSGAGLVYLGVSESIASLVLTAMPEALLTSLPEGPPDFLTAPLKALLAGKQAVAIGPGAGLAAWLDPAIELALSEPSAIVLDADGLNAIARSMDAYAPLLAQRQSRGLTWPVLTPHPGEFRRLAPDLRDLLDLDRQQAAATLARRLDSIVLLKGACTVIASPAGELWINPTGNAGLAKGGSGDVLTGVITALLAQGLPPFHAAAAGAYLHGLAADLAADPAQEGTGQRSLRAGDVIRALGRSFARAGWDRYE